MLPGPEPVRLLDSWKEIASHLGVTVRTAQKWEAERALPVFRMHGGRGRVSASSVELDQWRISLHVLPDEEPDPPHRRWLLLALVVVVIATATWVRWFRAGPPATLRVDGKTLVALDAHGREAWRHTLDGAVREPRMRKPPVANAVWFGDLDGDSEIETVLQHERPGVNARSDELLCFSQSGKLKWTFIPGALVSTGADVFDAPYRLRGIHMVRLGAGKGFAVAVSASHHLYHPFQVALLSPQGKLLREYWHSGHLGTMIVSGLPASDRDILYLGGAANGYGRAVLVALDPLNFDGASREENPAYQLRGFKPAQEIARVLFNQTRLAKPLALYNFISVLETEGESLIVGSAEVPSCVVDCAFVMYRLSRSLVVQTAVLTDNYYPYLFRATGSQERLTPDDHSALLSVRYLTNSKIE